MPDTVRAPPSPDSRVVDPGRNYRVAVFPVKETARRAWGLLPETVANSKVAGRAKRAALATAAGRPVPRVVRTLAELDECLEMLERAAAVSDDELRRGFATFRMELDLEMPADPFSDEYRRSVFDVYEWLHGSPYTARNEFTLFELERYTDVPFPVRDPERTDRRQLSHRHGAHHPDAEPASAESRAGVRARASGTRRSPSRRWAIT